MPDQAQKETFIASPRHVSLLHIFKIITVRIKFLRFAFLPNFFFICFGIGSRIKSINY